MQLRRQPLYFSLLYISEYSVCTWECLYAYIFITFWLLLPLLILLLLPPTTFPQIHSSSISLQKRASIPGISHKHTIRIYNKTSKKKNPSIQGWTEQPSRRKMIPRLGERVREPVIITGVPTGGLPIWYNTFNVF